MSKEARVKVWSSIDPDTKLRLELIARNTQFGEFWHIRQAIEEYVERVTGNKTTGAGS